MTGLRIIAGTRQTGTRRHPRSEPRFYVTDPDGVILSDHATEADAQRAAGIAPRTPAEIGALAGLGFELNRRFGTALFGKPDYVGTFEWIGQRADEGDETARRAVAWL